jgi:serine/threonine protein kinase
LLCDFGLSRIRHEISRTHTIIHTGGRYRFIAPEIYSGEETCVNERSAIYSLAMTIYALGTKSLPFGDLNELAAAHEAAKGKRPSKQDSLGGLNAEDTQLLWSLVERMWDQEPPQ